METPNNLTSYSLIDPMKMMKATNTVITVRNVVAERLCFHRRLWFCSQGEGEVYPSMHWVRPPPTATAADGTHPTGMHSCFTLWELICTLFCYSESTQLTAWLFMLWDVVWRFNTGSFIKRKFSLIFVAAQYKYSIGLSMNSSEATSLLSLWYNWSLVCHRTL